MASLTAPSPDKTATGAVPDDSKAARVAEMFREAFQLDTVGLDDNFFRLGGDSLIAETLIMEIERAFGVDLSISALIEAATPRALAALIAERGASGQSSSLLITPRAHGSEMPLICIHGYDGESMFPERLASMLPGDNPIYGFRAIGLEAPEQPVTRVEEMATQYLDVLKQTVMPQGPYLLLGHCGGSSVAYEMAQTLIAAGEEVAGLIMIDPAVGAGAPFLYKSGLRWQTEHLRYAIRKMRLRRQIARDPEPDIPMRRYRVSRANSIGVAYYRPKPLDCPTLFINTKVRTGDLRNPQRGYQTLLPNAEFVEADFDHMSLFTDGMPVLVEAIRSFMDRTIPAGPASLHA